MVIKEKQPNFLLRAVESRFSGVASWLQLVLFFLSLLALDLGFQYFMKFAAVDGLENGQLLRLLSPAWALVFTGIAGVLPGLARKIWMGLVSLVFAILAVVHGVFINMFSKFFSFVDLSFAGDGAAFVDGSYLTIRKALVVWIVLCFAAAVLAVLLTPRKCKPALKGGVPALLAGLAVVLGIRFTVLNEQTTVAWDQTTNPSFLYEDFSDRRSCMTAFGLYQYTFRDVTSILFTSTSITEEEDAALTRWIESCTHEENEMTGIFEGKNLLLIQLESIDTWMLTEDYMPNLWALKQGSLVFENHYTPSYSVGGTFNTEFLVNTSLMLAEGGLPASVYSHNTYTNSIASLFAKEGYSVNSFHGSEGTVYNRGSIHENLGYEKYWSGSDMGMWDYQFDRYLMSGYEEMTAGDSFFSFIITFSGHGAYGPNNAIGLEHQEKADAVVLRTEDNYRYAVSHSMETDYFIGQLVAQLEADGLLENTVLVFYADHYNYYTLDNDLMKEVKGVQTENQLHHTDFFIYDGGIHSGSVEKVTSSLDVLPTLANMFGLDANYGAFLGHDAFSEDGGYVFFQDNTWYDGTQWSTAIREDILNLRQMGQLILAGDWFANHK